MAKVAGKTITKKWRKSKQFSEAPYGEVAHQLKSHAALLKEHGARLITLASNVEMHAAELLSERTISKTEIKNRMCDAIGYPHGFKFKTSIATLFPGNDPPTALLHKCQNNSEFAADGLSETSSGLQRNDVRGCKSFDDFEMRVENWYKTKKHWTVTSR